MSVIRAGRSTRRSAIVALTLTAAIGSGFCSEAWASPGNSSNWDRIGSVSDGAKMNSSNWDGVGTGARTNSSNWDGVGTDSSNWDSIGAKSARLASSNWDGVGTDSSNWDVGHQH